MSKVGKKPDPWNQTVPTISDSALETVDGKDPGMYKRYLANGSIISRELTIEISAAMAALSISLLNRMIRVSKLPNIQQGANKTAIIEAFQDTVIRLGIKQLVARMSRATLKKLSLLFSLQNTKQRNIVDSILRVGLPAFLHEKCDIPLFADFCVILGLEAGKYISPHLLDGTEPPSEPNPPYITYPAKSSSDTPSNGHDTSSQSDNERFIPKASVDLERELADEIMLLGMEDLLKSFTVPILHDICVELGLLSSSPTGSASPAPSHSSFADSNSNDPFNLINLIMDNVFDLIPLPEYVSTQLVPNSPSTPQPSSTTASSSNTDKAPPSPFLNATENAKKRKRDEVESSTASSEAPTSTSATKPSLSSPSKSKKAKYAETSENGESHATAAPSAPDANPVPPTKQESTTEISASMDIDTKTPTKPEVKKGRPGRPPSAAKASPAPPAADETISATSAPTEPGSTSKPGKKGVSPSPNKTGSESPAKIADENGSSSTAGEDDKTPPKRRQTRANGIPSRSAGRPRSAKFALMDEDYEDDTSEDSVSDEDVRPAASGKGRAKYQAPPLSNIKKGVTGQDLHNLYNVTDLQDWCRQNKVDHTGKKSAVIKRILYTLDPVNAKPPPPKKSRRFSSR